MFSESTINKDLMSSYKAKMLKYARIPIQCVMTEFVIHPLSVDYNLPLDAGLAAHYSFFESEIFVETGRISQKIRGIKSVFASKIEGEPLEVCEDIDTLYFITEDIGCIDVKVGIPPSISLRPIIVKLSTGLTSDNHNDESICGLISLLTSNIAVEPLGVEEYIEDLHSVCRLSAITIDTSEMVEELIPIESILSLGTFNVEVGEAEVPITKYRLTDNRLEKL